MGNILVLLIVLITFCAVFWNINYLCRVFWLAPNTGSLAQNTVCELFYKRCL